MAIAFVAQRATATQRSWRVPTIFCVFFVCGVARKQMEERSKNSNDLFNGPWFAGQMLKSLSQEDLFRKFGNIRSIHMKVGFGFIEFEDPRDADDAVRE